MKKFYCAILLVLLFAGCKAKGPTATRTPSSFAAEARTSSPIAQPTLSVTSSPASRTSSEDQEYWTTTAVYDSCTVYAGATDYYFKSQDGKTVQFRNSNLPDEEKSVKVSVNLIDPAAGEGPPGANPVWVGQTFLLTMNEKDEVVAAAPLSDEESLGESRPEDAKKALEAAVAEGIDPEPGVILSIPEGFSSNTFGGHEGTTVIVEGSGGEVHIFIPDPAISSTGEESIVGESGLFSSNGWSLEKTGRQSQPGLPWATATFPFSGPGELEGVVWLGNFAGKEVQVTASAPSAQLDGFYGSIGAMLQTMQLRN